MATKQKRATKRPSFGIVSTWGSEAAAKKALGIATKGGARGLRYVKQFGKHLVVKPKRRNSSDDEAAAMYEKFHQTPATHIEEFDVQSQQRVHMAECGKLRDLDVTLEYRGAAVRLTFKGVTVACSPDGGQLYFVRGDQKLDLVALGLADTLPKDQLSIGPCTRIEYETRKGFHDFEDAYYHHNFGEEDGRLPVLNYDVLNHAVYLSGGAYQVKREGIVN